ncbi:MAG: hypothetical protein R2755_00095 [Acidimicrobiales bacterium]
MSASSAFTHRTEGNWRDRTLTISGVERPYTDLVNWTSMVGMAYLPVTTPPLGLTASGLPVSVQVVAPYCEDRTALHFARLLADLTGGGYEQPPAGPEVARRHLAWGTATDRPVRQTTVNAVQADSLSEPMIELVTILHLICVPGGCAAQTGSWVVVTAPLAPSSTSVLTGSRSYQYSTAAPVDVSQVAPTMRGTRMQGCPQRSLPRLRRSMPSGW